MVTSGWPVGTGSPALVQVSGAGRILDAARQRARALGHPDPVWPAVSQPVGLLFREDGVRAIATWLTGVIEPLQAHATTPHARDDLAQLGATMQRCVEMQTPVLRLYAYAAEAPAATVTIVGARKTFVFWDTEMAVGSREALRDMSALWTVGEALEPRSGAMSPSPSALACCEVAQQARVYERSVRDQARGKSQREQVTHLDSLLAEEARLNPDPPAVDVIPDRAAILWRPRRLELVDVERLRRWLQQRNAGPAGAALADVRAFIDSACREHADVLLDAFCTDSPEAI
jgi:hypothetical protein